MVKKITNPTVVEAAGNKPKQIAEYVGRVNSHTNEVSIAKMVSPQGWIEPGQIPEFDEFTVVLKGTLKIKLIDCIDNAIKMGGHSFRPSPTK